MSLTMEVGDHFQKPACCYDNRVKIRQNEEINIIDSDSKKHRNVFKTQLRKHNKTESLLIIMENRLTRIIQKFLVVKNAIATAIPLAKMQLFKKLHLCKRNHYGRCYSVFSYTE